MSNVKVQRTNSDILRVVTTTIQQKLGNDALVGVHVLGVDTSSDFSVARISVEIPGDDAAKRRGIQELERASGFIRNEIASRVQLRQTPQLRFILDRGAENASRVEELLQQIGKGTERSEDE
ncbi:MAG: 30S ribosome-binding factor RbfA [Firmicutes bacterium]|nr:30S ribosome-binding factor RbfA [Bacillota bacterium]